MSKGRKPVPTNLKLLRGNPGRRPINKNEPTYLDGDLDCPSELAGDKYKEAREEWARVAPQLVGAGVYKKIDRTALVTYCQIYQRHTDAEANLKKTGLIVSQNGQYFRNPYLRVVEDSIALLRSFLADFGMTPASRTRLQVSEGTPVVNEFDEFLSRGKSN